MGTWTPWGAADFSKKIARGIMRYDTPSHGGYHLSKTMNAKVHEAWRRDDGWYEEDCDWAIVALTFPECFDVGARMNASHTAKNWHPDAFEKVYGVTLAPEESYIRRTKTAS